MNIHDSLNENIIKEEIKKLKSGRQAIILSHYYQRPEVQEIADFVGDSLELSRRAAQTNAQVIVFCGVHFMAETAAILSPEKIVLLPEEDAGCPLADMISVAELRRWKKKYTENSTVVCYVNTTAEIKAESDIVCTSANAVKVVSAIPPEKEVLFIPDRNLGNYVARRTRRKINAWEGYCNVHDKLTPEEVLTARARYPGALFLAHPECRLEVLELADHIASTSGIINFARRSGGKKFIIGTERGILYLLKKYCPEKEFYLASEELLCVDMKATTLQKVHRSLLSLTSRVVVPPDIQKKALKSLERMLQIT